MPDWRLTWGDHEFTSATELTVGEFALVQRLTGDGWNSANPLTGPNHAANLLAVLVARTEGRPVDEVLAEIAARPAVEIVAAIGPD